MPENKGSPEEQMAVLSEFTKIPGLGLSKAKKLYEAGYRSLEQLKQASFDELAQIPGIGENRATLIKRYFGEEAFSGKPFQEASPPEKPSGKNIHGVREGQSPSPEKPARASFSGTSSPKSMHGKIKFLNRMCIRDIPKVYPLVGNFGR